MPKLALCLVIAELGGGEYPNQDLPGWLAGGGGPDGGGRPPRPDQGLPGGGGHPWFPGHGRPDRPDQGLPGGPPMYPGNRPPGQGMPPLPSHPIYHPDKPTPPGQSPGSGIWVIAFVPGHGFKWVAVSPGVPEKRNSIAARS